MVPTRNQRNKHLCFFFFAQECNELKIHLGMDGMQKWQRNARVRKYPVSVWTILLPIEPLFRIELSPPNELSLTLSAQVDFSYITSIKELNQIGATTEV